jgi:uncharacterized protein YbjT (DUF2867 family)
MSARTVWVVGATGLVGRETVRVLLEGGDRVVAWVRRSSGLQHPALIERVVDFEQLDTAFVVGPGELPDVAVCCLGTTIKQAGSQERFRRVDHDYVLAFARAARQAGARTFAVVTALGADAKSLVFYNRVKGEVEQALAALGFESLVIARPSLLLGEREQGRLGERLMAPVSRLLPLRYRGIEGRTVARALRNLVLDAIPGRRLVLSDELQKRGAGAHAAPN